MKEGDIQNGVCRVCGFNGGMDIIYHEPNGKNCNKNRARTILADQEVYKKIIREVLKEEKLI